MEDEKVTNAPSAILYIDRILESIREKISHHEFDCVLAYLNEKYGIDKL